MARFKTFNEFAETLDDREFHHEVTYWIDQLMTMDQWIKLDNLMSDALVEVFGENHDIVGVAGPIPFEDF